MKHDHYDITAISLFAILYIFFFHIYPLLIKSITHTFLEMLSHT